MSTPDKVTALATFDATNPETARLILQAQEADQADHEMTIKQALKKYKRGMFWGMILSTALIMEGYDVVIITSFYGQSQFINRFGATAADGTKYISASWQSGLSNSSLVGQLTGLIVNSWAQDRFGSRLTYMAGMLWMVCAVFGPVFSTSLSTLALSEFLCGIPWGVFQTLSTAYASEVVPTVLRPYVTAYVCMCWGAGILLSSGVVRAVATLEGNWGWRLPFLIQFVWPLPLFLAAYFAPESPWNAIRRGKVDVARKSLQRLRHGQPQEVEPTLAYIQHVTNLEMAETKGASFFDCFRGTNWRRTEINIVVWAAQILCGNAILGFSVVFLQKAGFSPIASFDLNIGLSACYIIGGIICWFLMARIGRATIYMGGLVFMFVCLIATGILGVFNTKHASLGVGILLIIQTLVNMSTIGPACYPIVAETPSGRLRYKTVSIGRFAYNLTGIFSNSVTPRMLSTEAWNWGAKSAFFYAGTNFLCLLWCWFRLPETKDRSFGEIDILFENKVPARKFRTTNADQFGDVSGLGDLGSPMGEKKQESDEFVERV